MRMCALILAAGEGTRMKSKHPKVTHAIMGKPLVMWAVDAAREADADDVVVVVGNGADEVRSLLPEGTITVEQKERLGTGHAVKEALPTVRDLTTSGASLVVLSGDSPLLRPETIQALVEMREETGAAMSVLTMHLDDPTGYGRIIREEGEKDAPVMAIVEEKDCTDEQRAITECNSGVYCFDIDVLTSRIGGLSTANAQGEYYLTDMLGILRGVGYDVTAYSVDDPGETLGVNSRVQLAEATAILRDRIVEQHMVAGVTVVDPRNTWIGPDVTIGRDTIILPGCSLMGSTTIGEDCLIGPDTRLTDCTVGERCVLDDTVALESVLDDEVTCGPRAYLRPGTHMMERSKAGTHVEIKKSTIGVDSKVPHLSYIGDATVGDHANIGAGTITCNYDGYEKHKTVIGDGVFVGSDTMLVAPVTLEDRAITGAGSVITHDVPAGTLAVERSEQRLVEGYAERLRERHEREEA